MKCVSMSAAALATVLIIGCASTPPPKPYLANSSIIGIEVEVRAPIKLFHGSPARVYFVKLDEEHGLYQSNLIPSNFQKSGRLYLLNATPGQYVAVGTLDVKSGTPYARSASYTTYFAKDLIEKTKVTVGPNAFVFMGSYVVDSSVGIGGADELQLHYAELISPGSKAFLLDVLTGDYHYRGSMHEVKQDEQTKNLFLQNARLDLADAGWNAVLK